MRFKTLQNALFKLSGGQAMPAVGRIVIYKGSGTVENQTYTPTKNGYFCIDNYSPETTARSFIQGSILSYVTQNGGRASIFLPVQKGQQVVYSASGSGQKTIRFFDLVGGAKSLLSLAQTRIRGGVLCLI